MIYFNDAFTSQYQTIIENDVNQMTMTFHLQRLQCLIELVSCGLFQTLHSSEYVQVTGSSGYCGIQMYIVYNQACFKHKE